MLGYAMELKENVQNSSSVFLKCLGIIKFVHSMLHCFLSFGLHKLLKKNVDKLAFIKQICELPPKQVN